jgi:hypothetical protein
MLTHFAQIIKKKNTLFLLLIHFIFSHKQFETTVTPSDVMWFKTLTSGTLDKIIPMKNSGLCILYLLNITTPPTIFEDDEEKQLVLPLTPPPSSLSSIQPRRYVLAVFKAEQVKGQHFENFRAEIAAFHIDRILKFHKTPSVMGWKLSFKEFQNKLDVSSIPHHTDPDRMLSPPPPLTQEEYLSSIKEKLIFRNSHGRGNKNNQ